MKFQDIVNSSRGLGEEVNDSKIVRKILRFLPERFYLKVIAIEEYQNLETMKLEELIGLIQMFKLKFRTPRKKEKHSLESRKTI